MSTFIYIIVFWTFLLLPEVQGQQLTVKETTEGIEVAEGNKSVLFYQKQPTSLNGKHERANYIHPLRGLNGEVLTEVFPEDHPTHRGVFWGWHQILLNDRQIANGWSFENIRWEVKEVKTKKGKDEVTLYTTVQWMSAVDQGRPEPIVRENARITVQRAADHYRIIDFEIRLATLVDNLKIGGSDDKKGYGGFCVRLKLPEDISFISGNTAVTPEENAVTAGPWMDFVGSFSGAGAPKSGIAVFNHPSNPGPTNKWILRRQRSMQNAVFPGRNAVDLPKGGMILKYRLVIHDQELNNQMLQKLFEAYAKTG